MDELNRDQIITITKQQLSDILLEAIDNIGVKNTKFKENQMMTVKEVCLYTSYKRPTIYSFVHTEQIPYRKNKGKLFFNKAEIDEWMNQSR